VNIIFLLILIRLLPIPCTVTRVIDGDTIQVNYHDHIYIVRYIGIDTPETVHPEKDIEPHGKEASAFNRELVEGRQVFLELDREKVDIYGRLLAYVFLDTLFVNAELIRQGYAQIMTIPPNVRYAEYFILLQEEARNNQRGIWSISSSKDTDDASYDIIVYITA